MIGCGGAGRAAALALALAGAEVAIANRGAERGLAAARSLGLPFVPLAELELADFDLFVHATPLGRDAVRRAAAAGVAPDAGNRGRRPGLRRGADAARRRGDRARGLSAIDGREVLLGRRRRSSGS